MNTLTKVALWIFGAGVLAAFGFFVACWWREPMAILGFTLFGVFCIATIYLGVIGLNKLIRFLVGYVRSL